ncbi:hypothetical protein HY793_00110 [Candidatus Desantisbacteria bacterium]|nr:hypothetical protein [Candidatus Desantisbacteria bacterium]
MAYRHVAEEERRHIYEWKRDGYGMQKIGKLLIDMVVLFREEIRRNGGVGISS